MNDVETFLAHEEARGIRSYVDATYEPTSGAVATAIAYCGFRETGAGFQQNSHIDTDIAEPLRLRVIYPTGGVGEFWQTDAPPFRNHDLRMFAALKQQYSPDKPIGVIGFSAGGEFARYLAEHAVIADIAWIISHAGINPFRAGPMPASTFPVFISRNDQDQLVKEPKTEALTADYLAAGHKITPWTAKPVTQPTLTRWSDLWALGFGHWWPPAELNPQIVQFLQQPAIGLVARQEPA